MGRPIGRSVRTDEGARGPVAGQKTRRATDFGASSLPVLIPPLIVRLSTVSRLVLLHILFCSQLLEHRRSRIGCNR